MTEQDRDKLSETDPALEDTVADVEFEEAADAEQDESPEADPFGDYDPEAGRGAIANKTSLSGVLTGETSMFVVGSLLGLVGVGALIFAAVLRDVPSLIVATVLGPPCLIWCVMKWRRWLGGAPHLYRLLISLGEQEDAEAVLEDHLVKREAKIRKKLEKLEAEQRGDA